jgi:pyruvate,orthophosphate dikinase
MSTPKKYIYFFGGKKTEGRGNMKEILGGKGAGLAEMARLGVPVPPGFTISTEVCRLFYKNRMRLPRPVENQFLSAVKRLEKVSGKQLGNPKNPLLVSVRSGAKFSMPGMMDTILNLGLNDETVIGLARLTGNETFAYDCYRRFIQMFGNVVLGIEKSSFDGAGSGTGQEIVKRYKTIIKEHAHQELPQEPVKQLEMARDAVFKSWNNQRAKTYRDLYKIPHDLGTAVNIQLMVFGNMGNNSATGVGFTRNPATGENEFYGEYLTNAQGEDVVAGIRTPKPIKELEKEMPQVYQQLKGITNRLERHYKDIQDFEFTVEQGKLYMLQTRTGKRTGPAAVRIAVAMVQERSIKPEDAVHRVEPAQLNQLLHPIFDPGARQKFPVIAKGLNASPGAASGKAVFTAEETVKRAEQGERVVLVRMETSPDDIQGMYKARGVLTATGGMTSHAAVVGRQMGKPSVVGCEGIKVNETERFFRAGEKVVREGDYISIDGTTGEVMSGDVPFKESEVMQVLKGTLAPEDSRAYQEFTQLLSWADRIRRLGIRANADIPRDAAVAIKLGAEGIGLCRTEHMFFAPDRLPFMREMILADSLEARKKALDKLLPMQKQDFIGLFEIMKGFPVTIRTLDPPLHEFLPKREDLMVEITTLKLQGKPVEEIQEKERLLKRVNELHEFNPMMGHRGCRLGISYPEITEMQVRAIFEAACELAQKGKTVLPEVMIPLVGYVNELRNQTAVVRRVADEVMKEYKVKIKYAVGTMIELPRAAVTADEIAQEAEFFSFGTNDLTQMTLGFSRDDTVKFLNDYLAHKIFPQDPFITIDQTGVGQLVKLGVQKGRATRPNLKVGICGEHGGDPDSVIFCHFASLNYVSCSPYRLPLARLAAAHAVLQEQSARK